MTTSLKTSIAVLTLATAAAAQWHQTTPATTPPVRSAAAMTYDPVNNAVMMFGGTSTGFTPRSDTWTFAGGNWTQLTTIGTPGGRAHASLVYDTTRSVCVMYGGANTSPLGGPSLNQTWELNGNTWTQRATATTPGGRCYHGAAFDMLRGRTVIYGGDADNTFPIASNQTWEYDGTNWMLITTANNPGPLEHPGMCYDLQSQAVILFGGIDPQFGGNDNTWSYDGTNWTQLSITGPKPSARTLCRLVYDATRGVCILYGGLDPMTGTPFDDTWEFDGTAWTQVSTGTPSARVAASMTVDLGSGQVVLFGGDVSYSPTSQTWLYGATYLALGAGCAGSNGIPLLATSGRPVLGGQTLFTMSNLNPIAPAALLDLGFSNSNWSGVPLPADLSGLGMTGCTLYASMDLNFVIPASAGSGQLLVSIPSNPVFFGTRVYLQGLSYDPGINPLDFVLSNALTALLGN